MADSAPSTPKGNDTETNFKSFRNEILDMFNFLSDQMNVQFNAINERTSHLESLVSNKLNLGESKVEFSREASRPTVEPMTEKRIRNRFSMGAGVVENDFVDEIERDNRLNESVMLDPDLYKSRAIPLKELREKRPGTGISLAKFMNKERENFGTNQFEGIHSNKYQITKEYVKCNVKLSKLTPFAILQFMEEITMFEEEHQQTVDMAGTLVDKNVRSVVMQQTDFEGDYSKFIILGKDRLYTLLQQAVRPTTQIEFYLKLKSCLYKKCQWDPSVKVTIFNFRAFHLKLKEYCDKFAEAYSFLAFQTSKEYIPSIDNKTRGLMKVFLDNTPTKIPDRICEELKLSKQTDLNVFMKKFLDKCEYIYQVSEINKDIRVFFDESLSNVRSSEEDANKNDKDNRGLFKAKSTYQIGRQRVHQLSAIASNIFIDESNVMDEYDEENCECDQQKLHDADMPVATGDNEMSLSELVENDVEKDILQSGEETKDDELNNMSGYQPRGIAPVIKSPYANRSATGQLEKMKSVDFKAGVCFDKINNGICNKEGCQYSHDPKDLEAHCSKVESRPWKRFSSGTPLTPGSK